MPVLVAVVVVASQADPTSPTTQWTALGILALVLIAVGKAAWQIYDRADRRVEAIRVATEETRKTDREADLADRERLAAALLEAAQASHRMVDSVSRLEAGFRENTQSIDRLEQRLR